jgi:oxaloacetate decarboxylase beta subunit
MLFLGNLLKESGVTEHLAETARTALFNSALILMGLLIGATAQGDIFLTSTTLKIFVIGAISIVVASSGGILLVKFMNLFLKNESKINPLIGSAGIAAIPGAARVAHEVGLKYDNTNHLLSHAVAPNVAGLIGSAMAAGILLGMFA